MESNLRALAVSRRLGTEHFHASGTHLPVTLLDFWRWYSSDLANNALRGVIAEYLVACDLGIEDGIRLEWDAYDLVTQRGIKVEVKSAAYLQTWHQSKLPTSSFGVQPTIGWNATTNEYGVERKRQADVYIFALLHHQDKATLDPLNVDQWGILSATDIGLGLEGDDAEADRLREVTTLAADEGPVWRNCCSNRTPVSIVRRSS